MQHNGAYAGALTSLALVPKLKLGIAILTNQDNHLLHETLKWQIIDEYLQKNAPNYTLSYIERQKKRNAENKTQRKENKEEIENIISDISRKINTLEEKKDRLNADNTISVELHHETIKMLGL